MLKKLKECKTLKEIFTLIGTKPFESASLVVIILWCLLPIYWTIERVYWTLNAANDVEHQYGIQLGAEYSVYVLGIISLYIAIFYLISRLSVHWGKSLWIKIKAEPWHFFLLLMLLWACISTALSEDITLSLEGDGYLCEDLQTYFFYAAVYVCTFIITNKKYKWIVLNVFNAISMYVTAIIIVQDTYAYPFLKLCFPARMAAVFYHFNHAGYYLAMGIMCATGLYLFAKGHWVRYFYAFCILFQVFGILVNSTFASFIAVWCAVIMSLVFFVRKYGKFAWRMITPVAIIIILCIASYMGYVPTTSGETMKYNLEVLFDNGETISNSTGEDGSLNSIGHGRGLLWSQGLKMIPKKPIFGYGPNVLDKELSEPMWINRPDNEFIQHAIFMGVPALLYYLIALVWLFLHQWKNMKLLDSSILVAAGCLIAYMISAQFGVSTFNVAPYLYMFWGMAAGRTDEAQEKIQSELETYKAEVNDRLMQRIAEKNIAKCETKDND